MNFYIISSLIMFAIFYQIGLINLIYISISLIAFLYGFLCFDHIPIPYFMKSYTCQISKGLPKIIKSMKETDKIVLDTHISGAAELDKALVEVVDLLVRDYAESWYKHLTSDQYMLLEMKRSIYKILSNICVRCQNVDWVSVITEDLPNEIGSHIRLFRLSHQHCRRTKDRDVHEEFFSLESETDKVICRQKICTDHTAEKDYLSSISEFILYIITSPEEFNIPAVRYLLREVLVNAILLPVINLVSDSDFINQYIVSLCKDNSYTSEYFIQALRMSDNRDELLAVMEKIDSFVKRLRSRDSGGDDDALIKAQLGSLEFVRKICQSRLLKLEEPNNEDQSLFNRSISNPNLASVTIEFVLERQIGISLFLEFLTMMGSQNYLSTYINILQYQTMYPKIVEPVDDIFYFDERKRCNSDILGSSTNSIHAIEKRNFVYKIINDSKMLKLSDNALAHADEKINSGDLNSDLFDAVIKEIIEILKEKRHFDGFKRSKYFHQFLEEIDYLCEDSLISEDDIIYNNLVTTSLECAPSSMMHNLADGDMYTVRIVDSEVFKNSFVLYTIVIIKTDKYGTKETWKAQKRYSQFDSLYNTITETFGRIPQLRFPPKKPFNNMTAEFLEKRSLDLQEYLVQALDPKIDQMYPGLRQIVIQFIQPQNIEIRPQLNRIQSIVNPIKTVGNAVLSMPDTLVGNFNKFYSTISPSKKFVNSRYEGHFVGGDQLDYCKFGNDADQGKAESIPIRILFLLVDEIFDLQNKSQVVRKGIFGILRRIVKTFFGLKVNKIILEKAAKFTSSDQMAEFVNKFKDYMWPNGKMAGSLPPRNHMTKMRTKVLCKTKMLGSVSDEVSQFLGNETTRQGVQRVYDLCQDEVLNRRLTHSIIQMILQKIFSGHNLDLLMQYQLCPAHCEKPCDIHGLSAPEWRDWGNE